MTVKPIVVIYLPDNYQIGQGDKNAAMLLMEALNGSFGEPNANKIKYNDYWKDYYWFCFFDYEIQAPRFEVFYEKDFTPIQYEELKTMIQNSINQQQKQGE